MEKFLKTLKVEYMLPNQPSTKRVHRVNGLGTLPDRAKFSQDGKTMTVADYFRNVKKCNLQYPNLPLLWVGSRDRADKILIPIEFCTVAKGQAIKRKMNENQTSAMIKQVGHR